MGGRVSLWERLPRAFVGRRPAGGAHQDEKEQRIIGSREEYELFLQRYPRYPRAVVNQAPSTLGGPPASKPLTEALRKPIKRLVKSKDPIWGGYVITVERGDGMTWSASAADQVVTECASIPRHHLVAEPRPDGFPQIVELIAKRRLIALAQETNVVGPLRALRRRSVLIGALGLLVLGALTALLQASTAALNGISILVPIGGALLAGLLFLGQEASLLLKRSEREAEEKKLLEALDKAATEHPSRWSTLIERLSEELAEPSRDRAVIVDDFDRIDLLTRETLRHYMTHRSQPAKVHEIWIVFEEAALASLSKGIRLARARTRRTPRVRMELFRQETLDYQARRRLAGEVGQPPERADFRLVKSIGGEDSDAADAFAKLLDGQYGAQDFDVRAYGPLELAYLLAVQHRTGAWAFREQELVSDLSSKASSAHPQVLQLLLPDATFNRSEVDDAIKRLKLELGWMLDADRLTRDEIELVTEAADVLVKRREQYKLPAKEVIHLYWALYWYSKLVGAPNADPYCVRKLGRHLVLAAAPGALEVGLSEEVEERFREALIWTARALLTASLPDDVQTLLERAEQEVSSPEESARLRSVCWQAYAVLGEEDLLAIILRLHPEPTGSRPMATSAEYLFVESLRFADRDPNARGELAARLLTLDREILTYGQLRGLWLALTIDPAVPDYWSRFTQVAGAAGNRVQTLVQQALGMLEDPDRPRAALAALAVSLGVWCFALSCFQGTHSLSEANDLLERVRWQARQLHDSLDERRRHGEGEDYVLRSFANELEVIAGAAALVITGGRFTVRPSEEDQAKLWSHIREVSGVAGNDQADGIARRMTLQALTWRTLGSTRNKPLGFEQLAALTTLRRVHLTMMVGGRSETVNEALSELAGQLDEPGPIGLVAHALAVRKSPSEEISAHLWARAAELGLRSSFGRDLETELCLVAISMGHAFHSVGKQEIAERLVANGSAAERSAIGSRLTEFDDEDRHLAALWLLNTAEEDMSPAVTQALVAETRALRNETDDPATQDEIQQVLELFDLNRIEAEGRPVAVAETLGRWEHRRESMHYAWMLHLLIRQPVGGEDAFEAAASYLTTHREAPRASGPVFIALDLAKTAIRSDDPAAAAYREVAFTYLNEFHPSMEYQLPVEANIEILSLLINESVGNRERHHQNLVGWEAARQERDGVRKLPRLVEAGKFFLVLWHYYETLYFFGLRTEPDMDLEELLTSEGQSRTLAEWRAQGEPVPEPMVPSRSGAGISADFFRFGRALFGEAADNPDLEDARVMFNDASLEALPMLFDRMRNLAHLPERIRTLLADHQAQLLPAAANLDSAA